MNREQLADALENANLRAFLRVIRAGESSQDDSAYSVMFGGEHFTSFADHPRRVVTAGRYTSTAAGAYQFLARTWDGLVKQYGFADFSPAAQDMAAVALIAGRGALADAMAGRCQAAITKCNREWASLPGSPYGQPMRSMAQALATFAEYGGVADGVQSTAPPAPTAAPITAPITAHEATPAEPAKETTMPLPLIVGALLPALIEAIPKLGALFGSGSAVQERNVAAATSVMQIVQDATGARNAQEAVEMIQSDPQALQAATKAVQDGWYTLTEAGGGGIDGARKADAAFIAAASSWHDVFKSPSFWALLLLIPLVYLIVLSIIGVVGSVNWSLDVRAAIAGTIVGTITGGAVGYYWGQSTSRNRMPASEGAPSA